MKIIITQKQFELLTNQFQLNEGYGLVPIKSLRLTESKLKEYLIKILLGPYVGQIRVGAYNGSIALILVKNLFPKAKVVGSFIQV